MADMVELGGLWVNESKDGDKYISGYLGNAKLLIFKNKFKEEDNHPDYKMYVVAKDKKREAEQKSTTDDSDLPF